MSTDYIPPPTPALLSNLVARSLVAAVRLGSIKIAVDAGVSLVEHVALVGTSSVASRARAAREATDTAADTSSGGAAVAASGMGVSVSTDVVRVDAGVGLVGQVRVVRTSGVRAVGAAASSSSVAVRTGGGRVNAGVELVGQLGVVGTSGVRAVVASSVVASGATSQTTGVSASVAASEARVVVASASVVASSAVAVRVDTRISLVREVGVVRTGRV